MLGFLHLQSLHPKQTRPALGLSQGVGAVGRPVISDNVSRENLLPEVVNSYF